MKRQTVHIGGADVAVQIRKHHWAKRATMRVTTAGEVKVTIPERVTYRSAYAFILANEDWLEERMPRVPAVTTKPTKAQREEARTLVRNKLLQWQSVMGVAWGRISIRDQSTRWGSCSAQNNLNFNWRITTLPEELQDYLVVHELAHIKEHNHSPKFWQLVEQAMPEYKRHRAALKKISTR